MSNIKAHLFMEVIQYIKDNYGEEGFKKVFDRLNFEDRTILSKKIIPLSWLPTSTFNNLLETADLVLGKGDRYLCYELGRYEAEKGIKRFYKLFIKMGSPAFVIKRAPQLWKSLHDEGELKVELTSEKSGRLRLLNYKDTNKAQCRSFVGYCEKVLEMSGAKNVEMFEAKCVSKGNEYCEFIGNWE